MSRLISFLMLLIISQMQISNAETIAASPTDTFVYSYNSSLGIQGPSADPAAVCNEYQSIFNSTYTTYTYTLSFTSFDVKCNFNMVSKSSGSVVGTATRTLVKTSTVIYSCPSGYFLSNSSGTADSSGQYCTTEVNICEQRQLSSDYILGTGYYLFGAASSVCYDGCSYTNSDSKGYSVANLTYTDHIGLKHTCSVASGSGSYYTANGSKCGSTGDAKTISTGTYPSMQAAYTACFADFIVADKAYEDSKSGATSTTPSDAPDNCAYGSSHGTFNGETITYCLSAPSKTSTTTTTTNDDGSTTTTTTTTETKTDSNGNTTTTIHYHNVTNNVDGSTTTSDSSTTSSSNNGISDDVDPEEQTSSDCQENEAGKVSCLDVGDVSAMNSDSLDSEAKEVSYSVDGRFGASGGTCPFGSITFNGHTYNQFAVVCDGVVLFKAIFLTVCSIAAAYIVFGFRGGD